MLLHHARRAARTTPDGALVPLAEQDRSRWDTALIAEGVAILQAALARDRLGEYQAQAAIAALHADARTADETDWVQIVEWYDELDRLTRNPVVRLNRAVAVGEADGAQAAWPPSDRWIRWFPGTRRWRPTSGSAPATSRSRPGCTRTRPAPPPTWPSAITSPGRPHACTTCCGADRRLTPRSPDALGGAARSAAGRAGGRPGPSCPGCPGRPRRWRRPSSARPLRPPRR